jgi:geranylgeranyl diphosphate synthase, type I
LKLSFIGIFAEIFRSVFVSVNIQLDKKMDWELLNRYSLLIEEGLETYFAEVIKEAKKYHPFLVDVYSDIEKFVLRKGKRIASCSTLVTYKGCTGKIDNDILKICIGIELYRHSILIHDDLVDRENLRRGDKTLHKIFNRNYDDRFGEGTGVFAGNITYALAMCAIMNSGFSKEKLAYVMPILLKGYQEINESQILDLLFEYKDVDVTEWRTMASKRAASLFKTAMLIGLILGDASERDLGIVEEVATKMGYSFDIQDDIIDTFAKEKEYGRPPCGDIILGKKPLHVIYAINSTYNKHSKAVSKILEKKKLGTEDIKLVRMLLKESGGIDAAENDSKKYAEEAKKLLKLTNLSSEAKDFFNGLINYVNEHLDWYK